MVRINSVIIGISCVLNFFIIHTAEAQLSDSFSDGNYTSNPQWTGDTGHFEVNSLQQLHLKSSGTDSSVLCTPNLLLDSTEWLFWVKMSFSPSANNFCRVYLVSDSIDLLKANNAYYLQLGESGSDDAVELFRQQGSQKYSVCRGIEGFIAESFNIRIKVTRDVSGNWKIFADSTGGDIFLEQASGWDNVIQSSRYFGLMCKYTSSNSTKFYFDDFVVRNIEWDNKPPLLSRILVPDENHLVLHFNEALSPSSLENIHYFSVDQGMGYPSAAVFSSQCLDKITLSFMLPFLPEVVHHILITGIKDLAGNPIGDTNAPFLFYLPEAFDVVINEIMPDPEPQVGLPPVEYIELYNTSPYSLSLDKWIFQSGTSRRIISDLVLDAGTYVILADSGASLFFENYGNFYGFSSFSLSNEGSTLSLMNDKGQVIHSVAYEKGWYDDGLKSEGGWSLEQIDPLNPCAGKTNWKPSQSSTGGTPGHLNSVNDYNPDLQYPQPDYIGVVNARTLRVYFTETIDSSCIRGNASFLIQPGGLLPESVSFHPPDYSFLTLVLTSSMDKGVQYTLTFQDTLRDCSGNITVTGCSLAFGLPEEPDSGDIVINEILFDPEQGMPEFFEITNISKKIFSLERVFINETDSITFLVLNKYKLSDDSRLFFPGEYQAFTTEPLILCQRYPWSDIKKTLFLDPFPSLLNSGSCLSLMNINEKVLDRAIYRENMHYPLLKTTKGVSLERISTLLSGMNCQSWHSASSTCGYATPAMKNSQSAGNVFSEEDLSVDPPVFSPDNDGYQDILQIRLLQHDPGYLANLGIYNVSGQLVRTLSRNTLLGSENIFTWDGTDNKGYNSPIGMYVLYIEIFNTKGSVKHMKKVIVLGGRI